MTPDEWRRIDELYHQALDRPIGARAAFLDTACGGDEELRREVEKLVQGHEQAGTFLASPAWDMVHEVPGADQAESLVGRTIGSYRILSTLGRGGMGEVYLAEDTRLGRKIALKLLPARFTRDADRMRRFEQEVRAASGLNHPNIITVYDIGETEAGRFIVMEVVVGRTLRSMATEPVPVASLLHFGKQIAEALAVAHAAGIVHRDIKPENIMVRNDRYVKVLDFGLARLVSAAVARGGVGEGAFDTRPGMLLGTMSYMSPEQARGEAVGTATDIFSLGILLYELTTGQHPFKADSQISVLHGIVSAAPLPPQGMVAAIPTGLNDLILRMLEKDPDLRPTAATVAADLSAQLASVVSRDAGAEPTVAVEQRESGVARNRLARVVALIVIAAAATGGALWLLRDRTSQSAATSPVETDPGAAVATQRPRVSSGGPASSNVEANRLFENAMQSKVVNDIPRTRLMLERALALDPSFAEARAWYAFTNWLLLGEGKSNDSTLLYMAEEEMRRAAADDPSLARAHAGLAAIYVMQGRKELVPAEAEQALKSNPGDEDVSNTLMIFHQYSGDFAAAQRVGQEALDRLPLFFPNRMVLGEVLRQQGDLAGAIREQEKILEQDPHSVYALSYMARTFMDAGDLPRARQTLSRGRPEDRQSYLTRRTWAILLALEGNRSEALKEMDDEVLKWQALVAWETSEPADFFAVLGDASKALDWLDRAVRSGDERAEWFRRDPLLAKVRDHPRFDQVLDSIAYRRQQRKPLQ